MPSEQKERGGRHLKYANDFLIKVVGDIGSSTCIGKQMSFRKDKWTLEEQMGDRRDLRQCLFRHGPGF